LHKLGCYLIGSALFTVVMEEEAGLSSKSIREATEMLAISKMRITLIGWIDLAVKVFSATSVRYNMYQERN